MSTEIPNACTLSPDGFSARMGLIDALITRAQAVKAWLEVAQHCDCQSVDVCGLFVDPTLLPPVASIDLDVRHVRRAP